jgi:D-3-phosphoglycerate dehydrogenase
MAQQTSYPKEKIRILLLEGIHDEAVKSFKEAGYHQVEKLSKGLSEEELIQGISDVHLLGIRSKTHITEKVLDAAEKLKAVGCFCIGTNQVDLEAATKHGVAVMNAPFSNTRSVAEMIMALAILLIRRIPDKNRAAHAGKWLKDSRNSHELRGKSLGIIGYGNIGSQVSILAEALGMHVYYYDIVSKLPLGNATQIETMEELLGMSDVVTMHVPATQSTRYMIGENEFSQMKDGAIFLNYSRGNVVNLDDLREAIESGKISGAGIDVYPEEPKRKLEEFSSPLQNLSNVILTPHIGGSTEEAQLNIGLDVSGRLLSYLETGSSYGSHTVPSMNVPKQEHKHRVLHIHQNVPGVLSAINTALSSEDINILGQYLNTNPEIGYAVLDFDHDVSAKAFNVLRELPHTIKARLLY